MTQNIHLFKNLWGKYISTTLSKEEHITFMQMVSTGAYDDLIQEEIQNLQEKMLSSEERIPNPNSEVVWDSINALIETQQNKSQEPSISIQSHKHRWYWAAASAILVLVVTGTLFLKHYQKDNTERVVVTSGSLDLRKERLVTLSGPQNMILPDGSSVVVRNGGLVQYDSSLFTGGKYRDILLEGEAYFDVVHNEECPFVVHTGTLTTTVLGTSFDIVHTKDNKLDIIVKTGRVSVNEDKKQLAIINKDKKLSYSIASKSQKLENVDANQLTDWTKSFLVFKDISYKQAVEMVEARFKVKIDFDSNNPKLALINVNAQFYNQESFSQVMNILCTITNTELKTQSHTQYTIQ